MDPDEWWRSMNVSHDEGDQTFDRFAVTCSGRAAIAFLC